MNTQGGRSSNGSHLKRLIMNQSGAAKASLDPLPTEPRKETLSPRTNDNSLADSSFVAQQQRIGPSFNRRQSRTNDTNSKDITIEDADASEDSNRISEIEQEAERESAASYNETSPLMSAAAKRNIKRKKMPAKNMINIISNSDLNLGDESNLEQSLQTEIIEKTPFTVESMHRKRQAEEEFIRERGEIDHAQVDKVTMKVLDQRKGYLLSRLKAILDKRNPAEAE